MNYTNRILVVDDDPSIHDAFTKIFVKNNAAQGPLDAARSAFTGAVENSVQPGLREFIADTIQRWGNTAFVTE